MESMMAEMSEYTRKLIETVRLCIGVSNVSALIMGSSYLKRILLFITLFQVTTSDNEYKLNPTEVDFEVFCNSTAMRVNINFTRLFEGSVFVLTQLFNPNCSYITPLESAVWSTEMTLPLRECGLQSTETPGVANGTVIVQMHRIVETVFDKELQVVCSVPANNDTWSLEEPSDLPVVSATSAIKLGSELFGEGDPHIESTLYFIVNVNYSSSSNKTYRGLLVHNCVAHDSEVLNSRTNVVQFSDPYGCPSDVATLPGFTVVEDEDTLKAYSVVKNLTLFVRGELYVTCGVTLCPDDCLENCSVAVQFSPFHLSAIAFKDIVKRHPDATIPDSLQKLSKRSVIKFSQEKTSGDLSDRLEVESTEVTFENVVEHQPRATIPESLHKKPMSNANFSESTYLEPTPSSVISTLKYFISFAAFYDAYRLVNGYKLMFSNGTILSRHEVSTY